LKANVPRTCSQAPFNGYRAESGRLSADAASAPATSRTPAAAAASTSRVTDTRGRRVADWVTPASTRFQPRIFAPGDGAIGSTARSRSASASSRRASGINCLSFLAGPARASRAIDAGEAPGHRVDGQVLRIFGSSQPGINIVVDAIEVTLVEGAGRVLIALTHPLDEWAIVIGRRLAQCAHWVTLSAPVKWTDRRTLRSRSRMVTF